MDIQNLVPVDYSNQRVLTTAQVAEALDCSIEQLRSNFKNHKDQFQEGVHYFKVEGGALYALKRAVQKLSASSSPSKKGVNHVHAVSFGKGAKCLNLWTCQGVARHSKLIDTPQAWELFTTLEKHYFNPATHVAPPVETSLFPDEPVKAKKKRRPLPEYAVVYAAQLDNGLVKVGLTCDFNRRIKEVRKETGLDVEDVFTSGNLPLDDARKLEATVKSKFFDKNQGGELYAAPFEQVKAAIIDAPNDKFTKLLDIAREMPNSDEKTKILLQAAAVLA